MDVPFHSSGAMSRAHYAIVRKVESSPSIQSADQHIFLEVKSIQAQLSHPKLQLGKCKECLVILLYCSMSVTPGFLPTDAFDFAFPHAINLAETGRKVEEKRLGYLFCSEMMPLDHELRLMLINTLRKDLESENVSYICLALDSLISSPNEDVIPAVQSRLHDLLSHDYSHVRRRALLAFRSLSIYDRTLLDRIHGSILNLLQDPDDSVLKAALVVAGDFPKDDTFLGSVNDILKTESSYVNSNQGLVLSILKCLTHFGLTEEIIPTLFDILLEIAAVKKPTSHSKAIILGLFKLFGQTQPGVLMNMERSKTASTVRCIRHFLTSNDPNDVYLFVSCLKNVDVVLWAGTTLERPVVLDSLEFERIMQLLNSPDQGIRRKTLRIVNKVDPAILDAQVSLLMNTHPNTPEKKASAMHILEIASIRYEQEGEQYAGQVIELTRDLDKPGTQVFKQAVETVLTDARTSSNPNFLASCAHRFINDIANQDVVLGPTAFVIATALTTEFSGSSPVPPPQLLLALATRLKSCPSVVQEPCLIAMMRIRAECDEVPSEVVEIVKLISQSVRRSISLRCGQLLEFVPNKAILVKIVNDASSSSLPDFLTSLQNHTHETSGSLNTTTQVSRSSSRASRPSLLKYAAYDSPEVIPRLRTRRMSNSQQSASSSRSENLPDTGRHHVQARSMMLPITAGDLALADGLHNLQIREDDQRPSASDLTQSKLTEPEASRVDLINLESPYPVDTLAPLDSSDTFDGHRDFQEIWNFFHESCDLRGWCNVSIDTLIRRLQRMDQYHLRVISAELLPFIGELKIVMISNKGTVTSLNSDAVALRLREDEDDSCLWRLRCAEAVVGERIQTVLNS